MAKGTNIDKTESIFGSFAATIQAWNRQGFIWLMFLQKTPGITLVIFAFSVSSVAVGYANAMWSDEAKKVSHELLLPETSKEVMAEAYRSAYVKGIGLGAVLSVAIIFFGISNTKGTYFEYVPIGAVIMETATGVMGYASAMMINTHDVPTNVLVLQLVLQSTLRGLAPLSSHIAVAYLRHVYGEKIDAQFNKWISDLMDDFTL
jgi:hypothetical protein